MLAAMGLFKRRERAPSLDDVQFDCRGYEPRGEPQPGVQRVWLTSDSDGLGLYLFHAPPDLPRGASAAELRDYYERMGARGVDADIVHVSDVRAALVVSKAAQQPSGFTYLGALTLAFRDFSYVLKVQCAERAPTGAREALALDRSLGSGRTIDPGAPDLDSALPAHPLSRARHVLAQLRASLSIDPEIRSRPAFGLSNVSLH